MSQVIRTKMRPGEEITVSAAEYADLLRRGLVEGSGTPAPPDPDDVAVAALLDDETSSTYGRLLAQLSAAVPGDNALSTALRGAFGLVGVAA